jgi:hypothetical protein
MKPADQPGARRWGGPGFFDLPVVHADQEGTPVMVTAWELTVDEIEQIRQTGRIWLGIQGQVHPPIWLTTQNPLSNA